MSRFAWTGWSALLWVVVIGALTGWNQESAITGRPGQVSFPSDKPRPWDGLTILFNADDSEEVFQSDLEQAIKMGAPGIQVQVSFFTSDVQSAGFPVFDRRSPQPEQLIKILQAVSEKDLNVTLHPILLIQNPSSRYWRGQYQPVDEDRWWSDYEKWILGLADIAQTSATDLFFIGSELTSLQRKAPQWLSLIEKVRKRYSGLVGYSANWDSWQDVTFHEDLDVLGLNGYFPLSTAETETHPTALDLQANLLPHLSAMKRWVKTHTTALLFTEVGYPAANNALDRPWLYPTGTPTDSGDRQRDGIRSFLQVFSETGPQKGIFFYALHGHDPKTPSGYTPVRQETQQMWTDYFRERRQP